MTDEHIARNLKAILDNEDKCKRELTKAQVIAQKFTDLAGTVGFAVFHIIWFIVWMGFNSTSMAFDPYPFTFLTMVVSLEAIFLTITLLISQNFLTKTQERRATLDLQINLLSERENTSMLKLLSLIAEKLEIKLNDEDKKLLETVDPVEVLEQIEQIEKK